MAYLPIREALTVEQVNSELSYEPDTGIFRRKHSRTTVKAGAVAGSANKRGYICIELLGRTHYAHRLAWLVHHGEWPSIDIDHINGDPLDNRIANLRLATDRQNTGNTKLRSDNISGYKGVTAAARRGATLWRARIRIDGRLSSLGYFATPQEAHEAYCREAVKHFGEYARFR